MKFLLLAIFLSSASWGQDPRQRVMIISDMNNAYGSTSYGADVKYAIKKIQEIKPDLVLNTGDMVAGQKAGLDYKAMWTAFHAVVTRPLEESQIPLAVTVGNHDGSGYPKFKNERDIFMEEWNSFRPALTFSDDSQYPIYYSFTSQETFFMAIDSTLVGPQGLAQLNWMDLELSKHQDKKFKVIFTHVPMFQFNQSNPNESYFDQQLWGLIQKHQVQLYLTGHHHTYYPGFYQGTHFVSQACLGAGQEKLIGSSVLSPRSMTVVDFFEDHFEIYALLSPDFTKKVDHQMLPQSLSAKGKTLILKDHSE